MSGKKKYVHGKKEAHRAWSSECSKSSLDENQEIQMLRGRSKVEVDELTDLNTQQKSVRKSRTLFCWADDSCKIFVLVIMKMFKQTEKSSRGHSSLLVLKPDSMPSSGFYKVRWLKLWLLMLSYRLNLWYFNDVSHEHGGKLQWNSLGSGPWTTYFSVPFSQPVSQE